jgi:hypothetical protein
MFFHHLWFVNIEDGVVVEPHQDGVRSILESLLAALDPGIGDWAEHQTGAYVGVNVGMESRDLRRCNA